MKGAVAVTGRWGWTIGGQLDCSQALLGQGGGDILCQRGELRGLHQVDAARGRHVALAVRGRPVG